MSSSPIFSLSMLIQVVWPVVSLAGLLLLVRFHKLSPAFPLILIGLAVQCFSSSCSAAFFVMQFVGVDVGDHAASIGMFFSAVGVIGLCGKVCLVTGLVLVFSALNDRMSFLTDIVESRQD